MAASNTDRFKKSKRKFETTVGVGGILAGGTTLPLTSVTELDTTTAITLVVGAGTATEEVITGVVSGSDLINCVRGKEGTTDSAHSAGESVNMYFTETHWDDAMDGILADHDQSGQHKNLTDANGNEWIKQTATASAVNEITVANAATGSGPVISATGGDTNVDVSITGKGTGSARFAGPHDGWVACNETLTYASASTFTCSAALAGILSTGDKIKLTQTTAKYFYVTGVSGTTVTVTGGSDYTLANAAITLPFYSKSSTATSFPMWFSFTPTWTSSGSAPSIGNGTFTGKFMVNNKTCFFRLKFVGGASTTWGTGQYYVTLPVTGYSGIAANDGFVLNGYMEDNAVKGYSVDAARMLDTSKFYVVVTDTASASVGTWSQTGPFTWSTSDFWSAHGFYEVA